MMFGAVTVDHGTRPVLLGLTPAADTVLPLIGVSEYWPLVLASQVVGVMLPVAICDSAQRSAASAACAPVWRLSSLRAMRSSVVCMRAALTPSRLRITSRMSATNSTAPDCRDREARGAMRMDLT